MWRLLRMLVALAAAATVAAPAASEPETSPTGRLVFVRDGHLAFMRGDGSGELTTRLAATGLPVWSPSGRRVAFTVSSARAQILSVDGRGGRLKALTPRRPYDCLWASWSPNGRRLAYTRNEGCEGGLGILVVNADGTRLRHLAGGGSVAPGGTAAFDPVWSRDGRTILFAGAARDGASLYTIGADGRGRRAVRGTRPQVTGGLPERPVAVWLQDGRRIVYLADDDHVHVVGRGGDGDRDLTPTLGPVYEFALSPDASRIAVVAHHDIYVLEVDGSGLRRLTAPAPGLADHDPRWSPDGGAIAFVRGGKKSQIYVVHADGGGLANISRSGTDDFSPDWAPR